MPSPEQLGVAPARPADAGAFWMATRSRLQQLGAVCFQVDQPAQGGWQFRCWLPTGEPGRTRCFEARAATEAVAVSQALAEAQRWKTQQP